MTMTMTSRNIARAGLIGVATGVLGALSALVLLYWPPQIAQGPVSYPFTTGGFYIAQAWFFVHHFGLIIALLGLAVSGAVGVGRLGVAGAWLAVVGMALLTGAELLAMRYADWNIDTANAGVMGTSYGIACTVVGLGMLMAGAGVLRARVWSGLRRWTPLAVGITLFAVVIPGIFGGFVAARLAIGFWMLMFAALGWSLHAEVRRSSPSPRAWVAAPID